MTILNYISEQGFYERKRFKHPLSKRTVIKMSSETNDCFIILETYNNKHYIRADALKKENQREAIRLVQSLKDRYPLERFFISYRTVFSVTIQSLFLFILISLLVVTEYVPLFFGISNIVVWLVVLNTIFPAFFSKFKIDRILMRCMELIVSPLLIVAFVRKFYVKPENK